MILATTREYGRTRVQGQDKAQGKEKAQGQEKVQGQGERVKESTRGFLATGGGEKMIFQGVNKGLALVVFCWNEEVAIGWIGQLADSFWPQAPGS